jgi:alkylation response protein AidB-like acyl-CoA dehydrogenase
MVLTEPEAGSDVGAGRARAKHIEGDLYDIEGVKRFITSGDWDATENIVHLVLARPEGAGPGTKGQSLFIVPKFWVNADGSLGERNGAYCRNLEKKMGIKGSATCEMTFGGAGKTPARGLLVGNVHDGIRQMFLMIEHARMAVGTKSMSTLSTAYLNALEYAKSRVQGPDLAKAADKSSPRVRIIEHPDVRRMLMELKAHAEGMRALCMFTATTRDTVEILKETDHEGAKAWESVNDLLLPLVKGYCSDRTFDLLGTALQIFGGSGYCQDYPIEQYIRDQKIDTLYEGTTHIQALDLLFRKILKDGGKTLKGTLAQAVTFVSSERGGAALAAERAAVGKALADCEGLFGALQKKMADDLYHAGFQANRVLYALSETIIGWLLVEQAAVALEALAKTANTDDKAFYAGKVASAKYFAHEVLPRVTLLKKLVENGTTDLRGLPEAAF